MARTGSNENKDANKQYSAEQQTAFNQSQGDIGRFNTNEATLAKGGEVAANPWKSAGYLSNVNRLQSGALDSEENAGKNQLQQENLRTGGLNTGATIGAQKDLSLRKMRLGDTLSAERSAGDFGKNIQYQQEMARAPLAASGAEAPFFGGAVTGQEGALRNLTQLGIASYGPWEAAIAAAKQAASGAAAGAGG